jgi:hypothetical protein
MLAKLVHKMRVFRDEDGEYLVIHHWTYLIVRDEDGGGDLFEDGDGDDDEDNKLVEIDVESKQLGFVVTP